MRICSTTTVTTISACLFFGFLSQWPAIVTSDDNNTLSSIIYVISSDQFYCPTEQCFTLNDLIELSAIGTLNFSPNTTLLLSHGYHVIKANISTSHRQLLVEDLDYFEISSFVSEINKTMEQGTIQCTIPIKFEFRNITTLTISGLTFHCCGNIQKFELFTFNITLLIVNCSILTVTNMTIANTTGIGLMIRNVYECLTLSDLVLTNNEVNSYIEIPGKNKFNSTPQCVIKNSNFSFGNAYLDKYKYTNSLIPVKAGGLHIKLVNYVRLQLINTTLYENWGRYGNFYLELRISTVIQSAHVDLVVKGLNSAYASNASNYFTGLCIQCLANCVSLHSQMVIVNSTFKESCVSMLHTGGNLNLSNVAIVGSRCTRSLRLLNMPDVVLDNVNISGSFGRHTVDALNSSIRVVNRLLVCNNIGGIQLKGNSRLAFDVNSYSLFTNNTANGSIFSLSSLLYTEDSNIVITANSYVKFDNNTSELGGAVTTVASTIEMQGPNSTLLFIRNKGSNGGAIAMYDASQITLKSDRHTTLRFIENTASLKGGAVYVDTASQFEISMSRTIRKIFKPFIKLKNIAGQCPTVEYTNNTAVLSGDNVYGGWLRYTDDTYTCPLIDRNNYYSLLSSDPVRVCICINSTPDCSILKYPIEVYPGKAFELEAVAVGWRFGTVPSTVYATFEDIGNIETPRLEAGQSVQRVKRSCTGLSYKVYSPNRKERLRLYLSLEGRNIPNNSYSASAGYDPLPGKDLSLDILVKQCPPGFLFNTSLNKCMCHPLLSEYNVRCDMDLLQLVRADQVWISTCDNNKNIMLSTSCPNYYCKSSSNTKLLSLNEQCSFNRSGILCGACKENFSQVLGNSKCEKCSNLWTLLIIPVFILAGIALVVFIILLNLTVSVGTINGLIFYANIVRANQDIFFPLELKNSFLSWFIAWVNLDFGIEACFYNGLDAYAKIWLQFAFPFYIWFIVLAIIVLSRHFNIVVRLCNRNAVPLLATLCLLSYAKLLKIMITIFKPATIKYSSGSYKVVWQYDGNVEYLRRKHIPLFIAALLLLVFLCIPYTVILLTIHWLQKLSHRGIFCWVNKFKPFFDAYTGPYKVKHRYWTGLLLLIRIILFLVFSLNRFDPPIHLLAIIVTQILILSHPFLFGKVYKSQLVNIIEGSYHLNLGIFAITTFYQIHKSNSHRWITIISTSVAFITFVCSVIHHFIKKVLSIRFSKYAAKLKACCKNITRLCRRKEVVTESTRNYKLKITKPTQTSVHLRETLLEDSTFL